MRCLSKRAHMMGDGLTPLLGFELCLQRCKLGEWRIGVRRFLVADKLALWTIILAVTTLFEVPRRAIIATLTPAIITPALVTLALTIIAPAVPLKLAAWTVTVVLTRCIRGRCSSGSRGFRSGR